MWFKMPQLRKEKKKTKDKGRQQGTFCRVSTQIHRKASSRLIGVSSFLPLPYPSLPPSVSAPQLRNVGHDTELFQYRQITAQQGHTHAFTTHTHTHNKNFFHEGEAHSDSECENSEWIKISAGVLHSGASFCRFHLSTS